MNNLNNISVSIIGFNEAKFLNNCLKTIEWAKEIIYIDCGSSDNSIEIAEKYGAKIFKKENNFNININKQFGIEKCSQEWILYLDPDESVDENLKNEIINISLNEKKYFGFKLPRRNFYFGQWLKYGGKYPDYQLRFFKNGFGKFPCKDIHEKIKINGLVSNTKNSLNHNVIEDVDWLLDKIKSYSIRQSEQNIRLNKIPNGFIFKGLKKFIKNYFLKFGFLDGKVGFSVALIDFYNSMVFYLKTKEVINSQKKK